MSNMFKRKLRALNHPSPDEINFNSKDEYQSVVEWLEDQKICEYKIEDREHLRSKDDNTWKEAFDTYCKDTGCPDELKSDQERMGWLLSYAVKIQYTEDVEKYKEFTAESIKNKKSTAPSIKSTNPLDNLDFDSPEFKRGVSDLAAVLGLTTHPDHLVTLQAVATLITDRLTPEAMKNPLPEGSPFPFEEGAGFGIADQVVEKAARILRLLHIHDLRTLQTAINETIVSVQNITADPKTDTKLGKVGF